MLFLFRNIKSDEQQEQKDMKKRTMLSLCLLLALMFALFPSALASKPEEKIVRVGWYESAFHRTDQFGRRSGYGYEYQQRIAIYTGWKYEYVEGSWSQLLEKLIAGEIDLLSDVSYTPERAEIIELSVRTPEMLEMLANGKIDMLVTQIGRAHV